MIKSTYCVVISGKSNSADWVGVSSGTSKSTGCAIISGMVK